jgi:hypothetical protein
LTRRDETARFKTSVSQAMSAKPAVELIERCVVDVDAPRASGASQDVGIFKTKPASELAARRVAENDAL